MKAGTTRLAVPEMDVELCWSEDCLWLESGRPWESLSSAVFGGGRRSGIRAAANVTVGSGYDGRDPARDVERRLRQAGVPEPAVGMMTAVDVRTARWTVAEGPKGRWLVTATAGIANAFCAGERPQWPDEGPGRPGTINIIAAFEGTLSEAAAVNAMITLTEVKARVLRERGVVCAQSGLPATGTSTDAAAVLFRPGGEKIPYAGPGSRAGAVLAAAVHRVLGEALEAGEGEERALSPPPVSPSPVALVIGGARSGKSEWAERWAEARASARGIGVTYVATARPEGMEERIDRHRRLRPSHWRTEEAADGLEARLAALGPDAGVLVVDCLSLWVASWLEERRRAEDTGIAERWELTPEEESDLVLRAKNIFERCRRHPHPVVVVTGEVGAGVAPSTAAGCRFRDALGLVNQVFAGRCDEVYAVVAGIPVKLKGSGAAAPVERGVVFGRDGELG